MSSRFKTYAVVDAKDRVYWRPSKTDAERDAITLNENLPADAPHRAVLLVEVTKAEAARLEGEDKAGEMPPEGTCADGLAFATLRAVNIQRVPLFGHGLNGWNALEWAGAMCGEAGEAANVAKKIRRMADGCDVNTQGDDRAALVRKLGGELADIIIYADLLAASEGIDLGAAVAAKFDEVSARVGFAVKLSSPTPVVKEPLTTEPVPTVKESLTVLPPGYGAAGGEAKPTPPATVEGAEAAAEFLAGLRSIDIAPIDAVDPHDGSMERRAFAFITARLAAVRADERAKCQKELEAARAEISRLHAACGALQDLYREQRDKIEKLEAAGAGVDRQEREAALHERWAMGYARGFADARAGRVGLMDAFRAAAKGGA